MSLLLGLIAAGCTAEQQRRSADREATRIIRGKTAKVRNMDKAFTIEPRAPLDVATLPVAPAPPDFLGADGNTEKDAHVLNLESALDVAVRQSREYQTRKELLFLEALDLSLVRHNYRPIFYGRGTADL